MRDLGFNIKIENLGMPLGMAGYCSTYWDEECNIVINPVKAFMTFFIGNNYMEPSEQLRMKALNYAISAPGEPILTALCKYYLSGSGIARMCWSMYYYEERGTSWHLKVDDNGDLITSYTPRIVEPSMKQRKFFEEMYNVTPERQIQLEELLLRDPHEGFEAILDEFGISEEYREQYESQLRNPFPDVPSNTCSTYDEVRFNNKPLYYREHYTRWAEGINYDN